MDSFTVEMEKLAEELLQLQATQKEASKTVKQVAKQVGQWENEMKELERAKQARPPQ
jgi:hypothetical protein